MLAAAAAIALAQALPDGVPRAAVVASLALFVPGYGILALVFGARPPLDGVLRLAVAVLLSVALYAFLALGLHALGLRLTQATVAWATCGAIGVLGLLTLARLAAAPGGTPRAPVPRSQLLGAAAFTALLLCVAGTLALTVPALPEARPAPFSQLFLAGEWERLGGVATAPAHGPTSVEVGVENHTGRAQRYRLLAHFEGGPAWPERSVLVPAGGRWQGTVSGQGPRAACRRRLQVDLLAGASVRPVASLSVWLRGPAARCARPAPSAG